MARGRAAERNAEHTLLAVCAALFAASTTVTIVWSIPMAAMNGMPMPGGWTMSMTWMRMPDQTWAGAAASLLEMWVVMMVAMMMPSLVPMLLRYRDAVSGDSHVRLDRMTAWVGLGYFSVWTLLGTIVLPIGLALAEVEMHYPELSRAVPLAAGAAVVFAGAAQFSAWKTRHLACCRGSIERHQTLPVHAAGAWRHGARLGLHCVYSSVGPTAILLIMGGMDLRVMAVVTIAITAERLAPAGERVARAIGIITVCAGALLLTRAAGLQ